NAETFRRRWKVLLIVAPDQDGSCCGIDDDVETVFRAVVDDDVEGQRGGNAASRALYHVHARQREAIGHEPALGLKLAGGPGASRPLRQEHDFPPPIEREPRQSFDRTRLDLLQRLPEV